MTLKQWLDNGWLRPHKTTSQEIENLFMIVDRDLKDAETGISVDYRHAILIARKIPDFNRIRRSDSFQRFALKVAGLEL